MSSDAQPRLRKILPLPVPADVEPPTDLGKIPELHWTAPTDLFVDETYQRELTQRSGRLIRKMMAQFAWNRFKPPIVVRTGGKLHVVDGQHTAIVAASLRIEKIPIFVVSADKIDERARAFVGHNSDRIVVPPIAIFKALLAAGDPDALDVANVCRRAGVRIRALSMTTIARPGDTAAVNQIGKLVKRRGVIRARQVLEVLAAAKRTPIAAAEIAAVERMLDKACDLKKLTRIIRLGGDEAFLKARAKGTQEKRPLWSVLVETWQRAL